MFEGRENKTVVRQDNCFVVTEHLLIKFDELKSFAKIFLVIDQEQIKFIVNHGNTQRRILRENQNFF